MKNETNEIREGPFSVRNAAPDWNTAFIITASWAIICVQKCGFKRPDPDFDAYDVQVGDRLAFRVEDRLLSANL